MKRILVCDDAAEFGLFHKVHRQQQYIVVMDRHMVILNTAMAELIFDDSLPQGPSFGDLLWPMLHLGQFVPEAFLETTDQ